MNKRDELKSVGKSAKRLCGAGRKVQDKEMETDLMHWIKERRRDGHAVTGKRVQLEARRLSTN